MINKRGQKPGSQRGDRRRFPYEPRVVGGKLLMPAELQAIRRYVVLRTCSQWASRLRFDFRIAAITGFGNRRQTQPLNTEPRGWFRKAQGDVHKKSPAVGAGLQRAKHGLPT